MPKSPTAVRSSTRLGEGFGTTTVSGLGIHVSLLWLTVLFVFVSVIVIGYAGQQEHLAKRELPDTDVNGNLKVTKDLQVRGQVKGPIYKIAEKVTADNVITASEAGTVFTIDDANNNSTLPNATADLIGSKFKFIIVGEDATSVDISGHDTNQCLFGTAVLSKSAAVSEAFVQPAGGSNSKITLNGTTTGGLVTGATGDTGTLNVLEITCVAAAVSGTDTDCWYVEAHLMGSGTLATPFAA